MTAEKFTSTVQSTPISISAITGDQLNAEGLTRIQDIIKEVHGLSTRYAGPDMPATRTSTHGAPMGRTSRRRRTRKSPLPGTAGRIRE